jgi:hypothetical protein
MASVEEPTRWTDAGRLPEPLRDDLSAYRDLGPSEAQISRMLEALAEPARDGGAIKVSRHPKIAAWKWGGAIVAAAVLGLMGWASLFYPRVEQPTSRPTEAHSHAAPSPNVPSVVESIPPTPAAVRVPAPAADVAAVRPARRTRGDRSSGPSSDPAAELSILGRARRLLASAPEQSLSLTEEHRSHYPRGAFVEERELLAIEALVKLARTMEARTRGGAFLRAHPGSAHGERVRLLLEPNP